MSTLTRARPSGAGVSLGAEVRIGVWRSFGATEQEAIRLLGYAHSPLHDGATALSDRYPLSDAPFVADWERYVDAAAAIGAFEALRPRLIQLQFPIVAGISGSDEYRAATRRGVLTAPRAPGLRLIDPDGMRLFLHPTPAGRVPVIVASARDDFEALVRALTERNEPAPIPSSMGACVVAGYNNWDRIAHLRRRWMAAHPHEPDESWHAAFRQYSKECYQDRFIILSSGAYSAVPAAALGLGPDRWSTMSLAIRLEHECAHYFTRRVFGVMAHSMLDELVADHAGLVTATSRFDSSWFSWFVGLEAFPRYRAGARLENYRGAPPLSDRLFAKLQALVHRAARNLEVVTDDCASSWNMIARARWIAALMRVGLEGLAVPDFRQLVRDELHAETEATRSTAS